MSQSLRCQRGAALIVLEKLCPAGRIEGEWRLVVHMGTRRRNPVEDVLGRTGRLVQPIHPPNTH
eukprot:scaffold622739_cov47-Attheya_sp.AAC.1